MKKLLFASLLLLLTHTITFSQTTLEEYNYVTKGWKNHLEDGSDIKKGYEMKYIKQTSAKGEDGHTRRAAIYSFNKLGYTIPVAYMVEYQLNSEPKEYICIPSPKSSSAINELYFRALFDGNPKFNHTNRLQMISFLLGYSLPF